MGKPPPGRSVVPVQREVQTTPARARRAAAVVGTGAAAGALVGAVKGGAIGVAAFGGAVGIPLIAAGAAVGIGVAAVWSLFFGGDRNRARVLQDELEQMRAENRSLAAQLHDMYQELLNAMSEKERLQSDLLRATNEIKRLRDKTQSGGSSDGDGLWVGETHTGTVMVFDPTCQLSSAKIVLLFLMQSSEYRAFEKQFIRKRLAKVDDAAHRSHTAAYQQWLQSPANQDAQKEGIAKLVKRARSG